MRKTFLVAMLSLIAFVTPYAADYYTVSEIMAIYESLGLAQGTTSSDSYTVRGYVTRWKSGYPDYQNADFFIDDTDSGSTSLLECFRLKGQTTTDQRKLEVGEYIEATAKLQNYQGRAELCNGTFTVLQSPEEPPVEGDCYTEYEGMKGSEILVALYNEIKDHTVLTYDQIRADRARVDLRADGTVWDMYSSCTFYTSDYCGYGDITEACQCYNREHVVPQSWWGNDDEQPMRTDLHHVIPTDGLSNSKRSAWPYGEVSGTPTWSNDAGSKLGYGTYGSSGNNYVFEPADEYKGDIARIYFYMATCYRDKNLKAGGKGYQVFNYSGTTLSFTDKAKALFLKWHRNDPVSDKEIKRNNGVKNKQGNRNPYIEMPELIEYIWGKNSGKTYTCQTTGMETIDEQETRAEKVLENGALFIVLPDGTRFTTTGARVR